MRPLEFRLWEREKKEMFWFDLRWGNRHNTGAGWLVALPIDKKKLEYPFMKPDNRIEVDPDNCDIMQFTGLLDKNDIKIFEGDIIENIKYSGMAKIVWGISCAGWYIERIKPKEYQVKYDLLYNKNIENCIIVGDIYQNPELLEECDK